MAASAEEGTTPSEDEIELPPAKELKRLKLSPEVAWYLLSRDYELPKYPPLIKTPEGSADPDAFFDPDAVDRVITAMKCLRHTQGKWAGQPLAPDPWQVAYILAPIFGWVHANEDGHLVRVVRTGYVDLPRKNGKALDIETPILTARGWVTMGEIQVGDQVHGADGALTDVVATSEVFTDHDCYEVTFSDGQTVVADAGHLWTAHDRYRARTVTVDTETMATNYLLRDARGYSSRRYSLQVAAPVDRPAVDLPIDPYMLGAWLGDGHTNAARLTGIDPEIPAAFEPSYQVRHMPEHQLWSIKGGFLIALRAAGLLGNKHVPEAYLTASAGQRLALLQGLMDTDGGVNRSAGATPRCEFVNKDRGLAEAVLYLARSLGWKATLREGRATLNGVDCGPKYRVCWNAYRERSPFRLARKTDLLRPTPETPGRSSTLQVVGIEKVSARPVRCLQVRNGDGLYLAGRGFVVTHNSTIAGGIALYLTGADGEPGAQVVAAASSKSQAGFVFNPIKTLAQKSPSLRGRFRPLTGKILHPASGSEFVVVSSLGDAQHGANIHGAIIDELHVHKNRDLVDAIETGTGARSQPLIVIITTPDDGKPATIYASKRRMVEQLAKGALHDPTTYGVVFGLPDHANPLNPSNWPKANPGYPISPTHDFMVSAAAKAKTSPADLAVFKRLHAGQRTRQTTTYLDLKKWDHNRLAGTGKKPMRLSDFQDRPAFGGLDLGSVSDLSAMCWLIPDEDEDGYTAIWRYWTPEDNLVNLDRSTAGLASKDWVPKGWLQTTSGNVTDYAFIEAQILEDAQVLDVESIGLDMWNATQLANNLQAEGLPLMKVRQGFQTMNPAMQEIQRQMLRRKLRHDGNPVTRWCVDNLSVAMDPAGNVKPDKARSVDKIDGVAALANAVSEAINTGRESSAYDDGHGLLVV